MAEAHGLILLAGGERKDLITRLATEGKRLDLSSTYNLLSGELRNTGMPALERPAHEVLGLSEGAPLSWAENAYYKILEREEEAYRNKEPKTVAFLLEATNAYETYRSRASPPSASPLPPGSGCLPRGVR